MNAVQLSGRLTADPVTRNDGQLATFGIAVNRNVQQADGSWNQEVDFVDCLSTNGTASRILRLPKGARVYVTGRLSLSRWEAADGSKRSALRVFVNTIETEHAAFYGQADERPGASQPTDDLKEELEVGFPTEEPKPRRRRKVA